MHKVTDMLGHKWTVYMTLDMKVQVELFEDLNGGYWWTKLKTKWGAGDDGAFNLQREQCVAIAEIYKTIGQNNLKISERNENRP